MKKGLAARRHLSSAGALRAGAPALAARIACIRADSVDGRFLLAILRPASAALLLAAAQAGDAASVALLLGAEHFIARCGGADSPLCLTCPAPLSARPGAIILLYAATGAREAVTLGVCAPCASRATDRKLGDRAIALLQPIFPGMRELAMMPEGHA